MMGALHSVRLGWAKPASQPLRRLAQALSRRDQGTQSMGPDAVEFTRFAQKSSMRLRKLQSLRNIEQSGTSRRHPPSPHATCQLRAFRRGGRRPSTERAQATIGDHNEEGHVHRCHRNVAGRQRELRYGTAGTWALPPAVKRTPKRTSTAGNASDLAPRRKSGGGCGTLSGRICSPHFMTNDAIIIGGDVMNTRRLVAAAVIATVITSPALAQRAPQQPQHSSTGGRRLRQRPICRLRSGSRSGRSCSAAIRAVSGRRGANSSDQS